MENDISRLFFSPIQFSKIVKKYENYFFDLIDKFLATEKELIL